MRCVCALHRQHGKYSMLMVVDIPISLVSHFCLSLSSFSDETPFLLPLIRLLSSRLLLRADGNDVDHL